MKKILVTGANSFLGHHVMPKLRLYASNITPSRPTRGRIRKPRFEILAPTSKELDLLNREAVLDYVLKHKPDTILHMAAKCGGIGANKAAPAEFVHDNLRMTLHLFDAIRFVNRWSLNDGVNYMRTDPVVTHFYGLGSVCFTDKCIVNTIEGYKKISDIKEGDFVIANFSRDMTSAKKNYSEVKKILRRDYTGVMYKIKPFGGEEIEATEEHPFYVLRDGSTQWVEAKNLKYTDSLLINYQSTYIHDDCIKIPSINDSQNTKNLPNKTDALPERILLDNDLASFFGWYLAEGCASNTGMITLYFGDEEDSVNFVKKVADTKFNRNSRVKFFEHQKGCRLDFNSKQLQTFLHKEFYTSSDKKTCHYKKVPNFILGASDELKKSFLRGYIDGDGHISRRTYREGDGINCVQVSSVSQNLVYQVRDLFLTLGIFGSIHKRKSNISFIDGRKIHGKDSWNLKFTGQQCAKLIRALYPELVGDLKSNIRKSRYVSGLCGNYYATPILSISESNVKNIPVYNFSTGNETYNAYGYAVHNCSYPKFCPVPFKEDDLWNGYPEETNAPYGNYKRMMMVMQQAFRQQFGLKGAHLIPVNLYGPWDHFDLKNSHVIPALLRKFLGAKNSESEYAEVWGDGTPTREFLYAGDCADAIVKAVYTGLDTNDPINIGTGEDISISDLANLIKEVVGFEGEVKFTGEVSVNGQPKRRLDVSRAKEVLGFEAQTKLREGLEKTLAWYIKEVQGPKEEPMKTKEEPMKTQTTTTIKSDPKALLKAIEELKEGREPDSEVTEVNADAINQLREAVMAMSEEILREKKRREMQVAKLADEIIDTTDVIEGKPQHKKLDTSQQTVFVKATNEPSKVKVGRIKRGHVRPVDGREPEGSVMQRFVKDIRDAVGEPDKLKLIAQEIDDSEELVRESREFLKGLMFRIERVPVSGEQIHEKAVKEWEDLSEKGKEIKATKELVNDPNVPKIPVPDINLNDGYMESFTVSLENKKHDEKKAQLSPNEKKAQLSPTDWLVRTGHFTREEAERIAEEGKKKYPDWKRTVKRSPVDGESVKVPELKERPVEAPRPPEPAKDLGYYENVEKFKRANAHDAVEGVVGGCFHRSPNPKIDKDKKSCGARTIDDLERQFEIATQEFAKKYGIVPKRNTLEKRGKRLSGNIISKYTRREDISDTEIMAALLISDKIKLPSKKAIQEITSAIIACPRKNEQEANKPDPKPEPIKTQPKVEKKKKTLFGKVKGVIKSVLKKTKLI